MKKRLTAAAVAIVAVAVACSAPAPDATHAAQADSRRPRRSTVELAVGGFHACVAARGAVRCWGLDADGQSTPPATLRNPRGLALGGKHSCVITDEGVKCWGFDNDGQSTPPAFLHAPWQLAAGDMHTCAIDDDRIACWGYAYDDVTDAPILKHPRLVHAGAMHTCAIGDDGVECWGDNDYAQCSTHYLLQHPSQVVGGVEQTCALDDTGVTCWGHGSYWGRAPSLRDPSELAAGVSHTCALTADGLQCWTLEGDLEPTPLVVQHPSHLGLGEKHGCLVDDDEVKCWGDDSFGQTDVPRDLELIGRHACFVAGGEVRCVGANELGQLGVGDDADRIVPLGAAGATDLGRGFESPAELAVGRGASCARSASGMVKCWGWNAFGQLGLGDTNDRGFQPSEMGDALPPLPFDTSASIVRIAMGDNHVCAVSSEAELFCWGHDPFGELGTEATADVSRPTRVHLNADLAIRDVAPGTNHTCVLGAAGEVYCFGKNASGQLGIGSTTTVGDRPGTMGDAMHVVALGADFTVKSIASGADHTCALSTAGRVKCWGDNSAGQLGVGDTQNRGASPGELGDALPFVDLGHGQVVADLACGSRHCCARMIQNTIKCWGDNADGQLGLGDTLPRGTSPETMGDALPFVMTPPHEKVLEVELHVARTCARTESGLRCWGRNREGELGYGDLEPRGGTLPTVPRLLSPLGI
jgi:alpha-tubulin suppressor-like RCC1 family protein